VLGPRLDSRPPDEPVERGVNGYDLVDRVHVERPRLVLLSNPHNPSGALLDLQELRPLAECLALRGGWLGVDEVYLEYLPHPAVASAQRLGPSVAVVCSVTKAYGLETSRFGWLAASPSVVEAAVRYNDYISVLYPDPCAQAGLAALDRIASLQQRARAVRRRNLPIVNDWLAGRAELECHPPEVGVMAFPRVRGVDDTSALCRELLDRHDTLVVPGRFFEAPRHFRLGFGVPASTLERGLGRIDRVLDEACTRVGA